MHEALRRIQAIHPNPEDGARSNATLFDNRQQKNSECQRFFGGGREIIEINTFIQQGCFKLIKSDDKDKKPEKNYTPLFST